MALLDGLTEDAPILGVDPNDPRRLRPGSRGYNIGVGATNPPTVPDQRVVSATAPDMPTAPPILGNPKNISTGGGILGQPKQPDAPEGPATMRYRQLLDQGAPKYTGFNKFLDILGNATSFGQEIERGAGLGTLGYEAKLGRARQAAAGEGGLAKAAQDAKFEVARTQEQEAKAEQERAKADALRNPPAPKPENIQQEYADAVADAQRRGVDPATDPKTQQIADAITSLQKQPAPPKENKAVAGTIGGAMAWGVQTDKGWIDPQTQRPIPNFKPAPNYAQVAPTTRPVQVIDKQDGSLKIVNMEDINANPGRYAPAAEGAKSMGREALLADIRQSAQNVKNNLAILDRSGFDRAKLAAALADPNSTAGAFLQSIPRGSLDDAGQQFVTDIFNLREQAMAMRSVLGAGQGSEDMRRAILQTLPGIGSPSGAFGAKQIDNLLAVLDRLERGVPNVPLRPSGGGGETKTYNGYEYIKQPDGSWKKGSKVQ